MLLSVPHGVGVFPVNALQPKADVKDAWQNCCNSSYLCHVSERVIVIQVPQKGESEEISLDEGKRAKMLAKCAAELDQRHSQRFMVHNIGRALPPGTFRDQVLDYNNDCLGLSEAMQVESLVALCVSAKVWLQCDPNHVLVLNCLVNQSALVAACCRLFLDLALGCLHSDIVEIYEQVYQRLMHFWTRCTLSPSDRTFLRNWEKLITRWGPTRVLMVTTEERLTLTEIEVRNFPKRAHGQPLQDGRPMVMIMQGTVLKFCSLTRSFAVTEGTRGSATIPVDLPLNGSLLVHFYFIPKSRPSRRLCSFMIHTTMKCPETNSIKILKEDIDGVADDEYFPSTFSMEFYFSQSQAKVIEADKLQAKSECIKQTPMTNETSLPISKTTAENILDSRQLERLESADWPDSTGIAPYTGTLQTVPTGELDDEVLSSNAADDPAVLSDFYYAQVYQQLIELEDIEHQHVAAAAAARLALIQTLPVSTNGVAPLNQEECQVCRMPYQPQDRLKTLPCIHRYHVDCIDPWLYMRGTCPVCQCDVEAALSLDDEEESV